MFFQDMNKLELKRTITVILACVTQVKKQYPLDLSDGICADLLSLELQSIGFDVKRNVHFTYSMLPYNFLIDLLIDDAIAVFISDNELAYAANDVACFGEFPVAMEIHFGNFALEGSGYHIAWNQKVFDAKQCF